MFLTLIKIMDTCINNYDTKKCTIYQYIFYGGFNEAKLIFCCIDWCIFPKCDKSKEV